MNVLDSHMMLGVSYLLTEVCLLLELLCFNHHTLFIFFNNQISVLSPSLSLLFSVSFTLVTVFLSNL